MSEISPISSRGLKRLITTNVVIYLILGLAIAPFAKGILDVARRGHVHGLDVALFHRLALPIKLHLLAAVTAIALGGILMFGRKGRLFHRTAGWIWASLVSVVAGSSLFITQQHPGHWSFLHLFTGWTLIMLPLAVFAAKRGNLDRHRLAMMGLFYGGFAINSFIAMLPGRTMWALFFG